MHFSRLSDQGTDTIAIRVPINKRGAYVGLRNKEQRTLTEKCELLVVGDKSTWTLTKTKVLVLRDKVQ